MADELEDTLPQEHLILENGIIPDGNGDPVGEKIADILASCPEITDESYFGRNPFVINLINHFKRIREIMHPYVGRTVDSDLKINLAKELESLQEKSRKHFGIEDISIVISSFYTMTSRPVYVGKIDLEKYAKYGDTKAQLEEYVRVRVGPDGLHFVHPEGKFHIVNIGVMYFTNDRFTPEMVAALFLHEIGHDFLSYDTCFNLLWQKAFHEIDMAYSLVRLCFSVKDIAPGLMYKFKAVKQNVTVIGQQLTKVVKNQPPYTSPDADANINLMMSTYPETNVYNVIHDPNGLMKSTAGLVQYGLIFINIIRGIITNFQGLWTSTLSDSHKALEKAKLESQKYLTGQKVVNDLTDQEKIKYTFQLQCKEILYTVIDCFVYGPISLLKSNLIQIVNPANFVKRAEEKGADKIAASYGLGPELAKAFETVRAVRGDDHLETTGFYKATNWVPGLNAIVQLPRYIMQIIEGLICGYPSDRARIKALHEDLMKELDNPYLSKSTRHKLRQQIRELEQIYNDHINPEKNAENNKYAAAAIFFIFRFLFALDPLENRGKSIPSNKLSLVAMSIVGKSNDIMNSLNMNDAIKNLFTASIEKLSYIDKIKAVDIVNAVRNKNINSPMIAAASANVTSIDGYEALDNAIVYESPLPDKIYDSINLTIANEAYFGKVPIVETSISHIHRLRQLLPAKTGYIAQEFKGPIVKELEEWGNALAKEFNVESCSIGLETMYNAYAVPFFAGDANEFNAAKNNSLVESKTGYSFARKDFMHMYMVVGLKLLADVKLSDETIVAILFHEIGHGFQQFETQSIVSQRSSFIYIQTCENIKKLQGHLLGLNVPEFVKTVVRLIGGACTGYGVKESRKSIKLDVLTKNTLDYSKNTDDEGWVNKSGGGLLDEKEEHVSLLQKIWGFFRETISLIFSYLPLPFISGFIMTICQDPFYLTDLIFEANYYKKQRENEYFADSFATRYGLGADLTEFFKVMNTLDDSSITNMPVFHAITQFNVLTLEMMLSLLEEHPSDAARIKSINKYLTDELTNNKSLSPAARKEIKKSIEHNVSLYMNLTSEKTAAKEKNYGKAALLFMIRTFAKVKEKATTAKDVNAPVVLSKSQVVKHVVSNIDSDPKIFSNLIGANPMEIKGCALSTLDIVEARIINEFV